MSSPIISLGVKKENNMTDNVTDSVFRKTKSKLMFYSYSWCILKILQVSSFNQFFFVILLLKNNMDSEKIHYIYSVDLNMKRIGDKQLTIEVASTAEM